MPLQGQPATLDHGEGTGLTAISAPTKHIHCTLKTYVHKYADKKLICDTETQQMQLSYLEREVPRGKPNSADQGRDSLAHSIAAKRLLQLLLSEECNPFQE